MSHFFDELMDDSVYSLNVALGELVLPDTICNGYSGIRHTVWAQKFIQSNVVGLFSSALRELKKLPYHTEAPYCNKMMFQKVVQNDRGLLQNYECESELLDGPTLLQMHFQSSVWDKELTRFLVASMKENAREFEIYIAKYMIDHMEENKLNFQCFREEFLQWEKLGLCFPIILSVIFSTTGRFDFCKTHDKDVVHWDSLLQTNDVGIMKEIDCMAVAMNVSGNSFFSLQHSLDAFVELFHGKTIDPFVLQQILPMKAAEFLPLSLFCFQPKCQRNLGILSGCLKLERIEDSGLIRFKPLHSLDWLERTDSEGSDDYLWSYFPTKIQNQWARLGALLSSDAFISCVLHPDQEMENLYHTRDCLFPSLSDLERFNAGYQLVNSLGSHIDTLPVCKKYTNYMQSLAILQSTERVRKLDIPMHVMLWRLDVPQRKMVLLNNSKSKMLPYLREKNLLNENIPKNKNTIGAMHMCVKKPTSVDIRQSIKDFFKMNADHIPNYFLESLHFFVHFPLDESNIVKGQLGERMSWHQAASENKGIDPRYTEIQESLKHTRYRDWVALYSDERYTLQSRLAAHMLEITTLYARSLPCIDLSFDKNSNKETQWVHVTSNYPVEFRVLQGSSYDLVKLLHANFSFDKKNKDQEMYILPDNKIGLVQFHDKKKKELKLTLLQPQK